VDPTEEGKEGMKAHIQEAREEHLAQLTSASIATAEVTGKFYFIHF
jgi:hypothetical protein